MTKYVSQSQLDRWDNTIRLLRKRRGEMEKAPGTGRSVVKSQLKSRLPGTSDGNRDSGNDPF